MLSRRGFLAGAVGAGLLFRFAPRARAADKPSGNPHRLGDL